MREVIVAGVGVHKFGKFVDKSLKELGRVALKNALDDAGLMPKDIQAAFFGNAYGGLITGQESVRGQTVLLHSGISEIPVLNVENACASGSSAFREAWLSVASGLYDVVLALGVEKLYCDNTPKTMAAIVTSSDLEIVGDTGWSFPTWYALNARLYMREYGATQEHFAKVVVKNTKNGALNPHAQFHKPLTMEEVLNSREVCYPLTLYMCSAIGDGAAAAVLCSQDVAKKLQKRPMVAVAASALTSATFRNEPKKPTAVGSAGQIASKLAYEQAGVGPEDLDMVELHDAFAPAELTAYEEIGLCGDGEGIRLIEEGKTEMGGEIPVNTSGGLASKGHPVGATGLAQIAEVVWQLRGEAGPRQIAGRNERLGPMLGLTHNGGGTLENDAAAMAIHILKRI
jgi:acetyl-CoA acetyltransferase